MSTFLEALLLGLVQGLTEFLPISSSGHLALGSKLLGWKDPDANLAFNIAVHFGSLVAVLVFVRREIKEMLTTRPRLMAVLAVATLPLVVLVLATPAKDWVKEFSGSLVAVGAFLLCTGAVLALVRRMSGGDDEADLPLLKALLIGCAQVFAILPGISRSGVTLAAGLRAGMKADQAVRFAFLMAVPAIGGAFLFMLMDGGLDTGVELAPMVGGAVVSFLTSLVAMKLMVGVVARRNLGWFAVYCGMVGVTALAAGLFG